MVPGEPTRRETVFKKTYNPYRPYRLKTSSSHPLFTKSRLSWTAHLLRQIKKANLLLNRARTSFPCEVGCFVDVSPGHSLHKFQTVFMSSCSFFWQVWSMSFFHFLIRWQNGPWSVAAWKMIPKFFIVIFFIYRSGACATSSAFYQFLLSIARVTFDPFDGIRWSRWKVKGRFDFYILFCERHLWLTKSPDW